MSTYDRTYDYGRKPKSLDEVRIGGHVAAYVGQIGEPPHGDFQEEREVHGEVLAINRDTGKIYARPTGTSPDRVIALELADIFWSQYSVAQQASDAQLRRYLEKNWDPVIGDWRNKLSDEEREAEIKGACDWDPVIGAWVRKDLSELERESTDTIRNAWRGDVPLIDWIANENGQNR